MSTAPDQLPLTLGLPASAQSPGSTVGRDREKYVEEVRLRWSGECLANAKLNWHLFEEHHDDLVEILRPYLRDCWCEDLAGKMHNPEGSLTSWLWICTNANSWLWDFCNHYQKCFLRRGLIAYCKQVIAEMRSASEL